MKLNKSLHSDPKKLTLFGTGELRVICTDESSAPMDTRIERTAELITAAFSQEAADDFRNFRPTDAQLNQLGIVGRDVLESFPSKPGMCAMMTTMFVARWEMEPRPAVYAVAGELYVGGTRVFGTDTTADTINDDIGQSNSSWDGHYWLVFGRYIADVSIFRTARSAYSPPALASHVKNNCDSNIGLMIANPEALSDFGFRYVPHAVLTPDQVTGQVRGAQAFFQSMLPE